MVPSYILIENLSTSRAVSVENTAGDFLIPEIPAGKFAMIPYPLTEIILKNVFNFVTETVTVETTIIAA
jgi:hypothetical protein